MICIDKPMPKCCDECFALDDHGDYPFCLISQDQRGYNFNTREKRMPTCPLKAQEAKLVHVTVKINYQKIGECPTCGNLIDSGYYPNYCGACGQAVKWK